MGTIAQNQGAMWATELPAYYMPDAPIFYVRCYMCECEEEALLDADGRPDVPPHWRALAPKCCPDYEVYACSPRCTVATGASVATEHRGPVRARKTELPPLEPADVKELLKDCKEAATDIPSPFTPEEMGFINNADAAFAYHGQLPAWQCERLEDLWRRIEE